MLKAIIFDWDGTIVDSVKKIWACKAFLAKKHNLPVPNEKTVRSVLGLQFEKALAVCFPDASLSMLKEIGMEFHHLMKEDAYQGILFPHAEKVLRLLKVKGFKLGVATSKERHELSTAILYNKLSEMFDMTCCGEEHEPKPNPAMLRFLVKKWEVKEEECLMVGDTTHDIQFAKNANISALAVSFGAHSSEKLQSLAPLAIANNWLQLYDLILSF